MTPQDNQQLSCDDFAFIQGKLLLDLGFLEIFQLKEFSKETPAVAALLRKANNPKFKSKIRKVLNIHGTKLKRKEAIPLLRRLLKTLGLKTQELYRNSQRPRFYKIISEDDNIFLIFQAFFGLKDENKFIEICQNLFERHNPKTESIFWENSGVYQITCFSTRDFYIGGCQNFRSRFRQHESELKSPRSHHSKKMQKLWNQHGEKNFKFETLEITEDYKEREKYWIKKLNPTLNYQHSELIRIDNEISKRLEVESKRLGKDRTELVNELLDKGLRELES